jgi:DNA-binding MarR family transcriptional regulator
MATSDHVLTKAQYERLADFRYQLRRYLRFSEEIIKRERITPLQYLLLLQIKGFPGRDWATVGELAERLQASHHGAVALVDRCEKQGLVVRAPDPSNRRQVQVRLKPKGERCLARLAGLHRKQLIAIRGALTAPDLEGIYGS